MLWNAMYHTTVASLFALLIYTNREEIRQRLFSREDEALRGLNNAIGDISPNYNKVAIGVNANVDLIVPALQVFAALDMKTSQSSVKCISISSLDELESCFSYFFRACAAAERVVTDGDLFQQIVKASSTIEFAQYDIGGNAALMGLKMLYSNKNSTILLGGPVGPKLSSLLPPGIEVVIGSRQAMDEYHIIMEYAVGDLWAGHTSSCANRFIITHDHANGHMISSDAFFAALPAFSPELIVISGLHLLEGEHWDIQYQKIEELRKHLITLPHTLPGTPVHLELASMTSIKLIEKIVSQILPCIDSIGLNEQELSFIATSLGGPGAAIELDQWPPEIGLMADVLDWMLTTFGKNNAESKPSRLSRIHLHSLTYHIIASYEDCWFNSLPSTAAGSRAASRQACDREEIYPEEVELRTPEYFARSVKWWNLRRVLIKHDRANPVSVWRRNGISFHFSAVLVCKRPKRTVGLGDCISATGLQYTTFVRNCTFHEEKNIE